MGIEKIINRKKYEYFEKYHSMPKYIKMPLWLFEELKKHIAELATMYIEYDTGTIKFEGLIICDTISIYKFEEIEVF